MLASIQRTLSKQKQRYKGFTIVELLIVVVVIGILAAIVTVAYTGISKTAQVASITSELKQWHKLFEAYRATNGHYPAPSATPTTGGGPGSNVLGGYCLGTGFPNSHCLLPYASSYGVAESTGTALMTALSTVGTPPRNSAKYTYATVGPFLWYRSDTNVQLYTTYPAGTPCPSGTVTAYADTVRQDCYIVLDYTE